MSIAVDVVGIEFGKKQMYRSLSKRRGRRRRRRRMLYFTHYKFPVNGTGNALLNIEQIVKECDATMNHSSNPALAHEIIAHFYAARSICYIWKHQLRIIKQLNRTN
ncbi:MAG: hypothetical protein JWQ09_3607 [Segetibacter sp.]|nr:hypothetical protein [Segetibacter sp.]